MDLRSPPGEHATAAARPAPRATDASNGGTGVDEPERRTSVQQAETEFARRLVARILAGDRSAEAELVNHYERGIRRVLRKSCLNDDDREELLQDTWETAIEKIRGGKLHDHGVLGAFVCGIAHWKAKNRVRWNHNRPTTGDPAVMDELLSEEDEPDRALSRAQDAELVWEVLERMRPRDREILIHFVLLEEDKDEVCASLGVSIARFHGVLCRARQRFHRLLSKKTE
jgi:RNA polymerase sigma-70 factor (ECF subfamily)